MGQCAVRSFTNLPRACFSLLLRPGHQKATPKTRTVIVDSKFADDYWEGEADITIDGYTTATFKPMHKAFLEALGKALGVNSKGPYRPHHLVFACPHHCKFAMCRA